jgi:Holliday junction resolvasome RuvABC endonuclease subunit
MTTILGLDVSTSNTGVCIIDNSKGETIQSQILLLGHVPLKTCKDFWTKCDAMKQYLINISTDYKIDKVSIEEPLMGYAAGHTSVQTIAMLLKFNGIVSYVCRDVFKVEPSHISAAHARKLCGIKMQKTKVGGPQKQQVFNWLKEHDLHHIPWQTKKTGTPVDWAYDATDAFVIAKAGL